VTNAFAGSTSTYVYRSAYARRGESFRNGRDPRRDAGGGEAGTLRYVGSPSSVCAAFLDVFTPAGETVLAPIDSVAVYAYAI